MQALWGETQRKKRLALAKGNRKENLRENILGRKWSEI